MQAGADALVVKASDFEDLTVALRLAAQAAAARAAGGSSPSDS
jgi:DNA-binding NarL/FixJ family response regulator